MRFLPIFSNFNKRKKPKVQALSAFSGISFPVFPINGMWKPRSPSTGQVMILFVHGIDFRDVGKEICVCYRTVAWCQEASSSISREIWPW